MTRITTSAERPEIISLNSSFEIGIIRQGVNWRTEMTLVKQPLLSFVIAIFRLARNQDANPSWQVELTIAETRQLRQLLNSPEIAVYLGSSAEEA